MHLQRNATQRNATQRNAYQNYILNNNFKFYIYQFFRAFNFLSVFIRFAKISSFIKESKSSYFFEWQKSKHAKGGQSSKIDFFLSKRDKAKARFQRKTTPFRIRNSLVKTFLQYSESPSLRGFAKNRSNLFSGLLHFVRNDKFKISNDKFKISNDKFKISNDKFKISNDKFKISNDNFNYAFSCATKNKFEIISRNENYAFDYNKYFCRNGNNRKNDLFSRNDYGEKFIFGFWNNFNFGFLFNRKIKK